MDNSKIRKEIKQKRLALSENTYQSMSLSCFENMKKLLTQLNYQSVGIYVSIHYEVDTKQLIEYLWQLGKDVYVPKCLKNHQMTFCKITSWKDVDKGSYGLLEPITTLENNQLDLQIISVIAYDKNGYRLGVGGGYYDRYTSKNSSLRIGLAFSFQNIPFLVKEHDLKFDYIINENNIIKF